MLTTQSPTCLQGHYALPSCPKAWRRTKFQKQLFKEKKQWYFPHCGSYWISRQSLTHAWSSIQSFCIHTWYNWCISASIPDTTDASLHKYLIQLMYFCIVTWYNWCISALIPDMTDVLYIYIYISASIPDTTDVLYIYLHWYLIRLVYFCIDTWYNWWICMMMGTSVLFFERPALCNHKIQRQLYNHTILPELLIWLSSDTCKL